MGQTPSKRYGHTITFSNPNVVLFGGVTGNEPFNDSWCLDVDKNPFQWEKLQCKGDIPAPRVYHSAAYCQSGAATGMVVIFGGRSGDRQRLLNDTWGIRKHRDGTWDWVKAPYNKDGYVPKPRFQHAGLFLGSMMFIVGGRSSEMGNNLNLDIFDTETSEWFTSSNIQRFRHISWIFQDNLYIQGGFEQSNPELPINEIYGLNLTEAFAHSPHTVSRIQTFVEKFSSPHPSASNSPLVTPDMSPRANSDIPRRVKPVPQTQQFQITPPVGLYKPPTQTPNTNIVVMIPGMEKDNNAGSLHMQFINKLLKPKDYDNPPENSRFHFSTDQIIQLCNDAENVIRNQPIVLRLDSPAKIFGDIHGQYSDLMRFLDLWNAPYDTYKGTDGDIDLFDYIFLGDFVDRGSHSLETICLLLALKIKYPDSIHLIRGNHEDRQVNSNFGFAEECEIRLDENPLDPDSVFNRINDLFDYLPLAAVIDEKILCLHGGIGGTLKRVEQIEKLKRPLEVIHEVQTDTEKLIVDILWSDPTENDSELGIQQNWARDPNGLGNIVKFGPDIVHEFLKANDLVKIIRAHECVMDGMERFAGGELITVFSATDYCGRHKNAGAVLYLKKNFEITPKLIYPQNLTQSNWYGDDDSLLRRPPTPPRWSGG